MVYDDDHCVSKRQKRKTVRIECERQNIKLILVFNLIASATLESIP